MKKIRIKIEESTCGSGKRDMHMHGEPCAAEAPYPKVPNKYKNAHNNEEARMHRTTLAHLLADVKVLLDLIEDQDDLPEWLETKITKAGDYMSSAARYIAGNVAREQGQLEEKKNCGCGLNPCKTYGIQEQTKPVEITKNPKQAVADIQRGIAAINTADLESLPPADLQALVQAITNAQQVLNISEILTIDEGLVGLTEHILVESHFKMYDYLQDAIDEHGEKPCPQCLYEVLSEASCGCPDLIPEAKYRGRKVKLNKPMRGDVKKFKVYVKNAKGNVVKVNFGHGGSSAKKKGEKTMKIRKSNKKARKSFRARHNCKNPGPKWKARYWSCRKW